MRFASVRPLPLSCELLRFGYGPAVNVVIAAALVLLFGASLEPRTLAAVDDISVEILHRRFRSIVLSLPDAETD